jgi:hypothetical protein
MMLYSILLFAIDGRKNLTQGFPDAPQLGMPGNFWLISLNKNQYTFRRDDAATRYVRKAALEPFALPA